MTSAPWRGTKVQFVPVKPGQSNSSQSSRVAGSRLRATRRRSSNSVVTGPTLTNVNDFRAVLVGVGGAGGEGGDA